MQKYIEKKVTKANNAVEATRDSTRAQLNTFK